MNLKYSLPVQKEHQQKEQPRETDPSSIAKDLNHSQKEKRYYCFGKVGDGIITVRFTYRNSVIRIIGAGYWRKGRKIYESQNQIY
ncbi:MAG: hypothetical protein CVT98_02455 [Bacteroidetes bacterium HGW-Bacteroidetes-15]|nr:MAG: hypothetical protein CVT98_02455 [Bacteroidetes bacterium HGW-Bacteroidetes-15]